MKKLSLDIFKIKNLLKKKIKVIKIFKKISLSKINLLIYQIKLVFISIIKKNLNNNFYYKEFYNSQN